MFDIKRLQWNTVFLFEILSEYNYKNNENNKYGVNSAYLTHRCWMMYVITTGYLNALLKSIRGLFTYKSNEITNQVTLS